MDLSSKIDSLSPIVMPYCYLDCIRGRYLQKGAIPLSLREVSIFLVLAPERGEI